MQILDQNESARESQSGKIESDKRASLFLIKCAGLGMHCQGPPGERLQEYSITDSMSSILFVIDSILIYVAKALK